MSRLGGPWDPANLRSFLTRSKAFLSLGSAQLCPSDKGEERCHTYCLWPFPFQVLAEVGKGFFSALAPKQLEKGYANNIFTSFLQLFFFFF